MFVQVDATLDRSEGGLGVGLTLVRKLVQLHEGTIEVHSEGVGKGSEFTVVLPRGMAAVETDAEPWLNGRTGKRRTLVLVEDRDEIRESLSELLQEEGYDVDTAADGLSGFDLICERIPGAALLDIGLPGMDGYQLARRLRARPETAHIPLIAMTGYGQDEDRIAVTNAGFNDHLVKPVMLDDLLVALDRLGFGAPMAS